MGIIRRESSSCRPETLAVARSTQGFNLDSPLGRDQSGTTSVTVPPSGEAVMSQWVRGQPFDAVVEP